MNASEDAQHSPSPARIWGGVVPLLVAWSLVSYVNRLSMTAAGDARVMDQYGWSPTRMGTVYSAFLVTYTICMIPGGLYIDKFRPKAALLTVGIGSAVFEGLTGVVGLTTADGAAAYVALVVVRGLMGAVSAPLYPACAAAVGRWVPSGSRSRTNGMINGAALIGVAITPLVFGWLIRRYDWPGAFLVAALVTAELAVVWSVTVTDGAGKADSGSEGGSGRTPRALAEWLELLADRSLVLLTLSYAAVGYFQYLFFYWMNYYFQRVLVLPEATSHFYAAIPPLAMAVGMPLGGWLGDQLERVLGPRTGRRLVPMAGMTAGALLLTLGVFAREPAWIVTWFALALGAVGMAEGPFWVSAVEVGGRRGGSAAAILNTGGNAGGMLAPVVTPWVGENYGWAYAVSLGAVVCISGVLLWLGVRSGTRKADIGPAPPIGTGL
jgi:MFS family permease